MALSARRVGRALIAVVGMGALLSGCSADEEFAATLNRDGHVQIDWCLASPDLVVESSSGEVLQLNAKRSEAPGVEDDLPDYVDLESPSSVWIVSGDLDFDTDTVLTIWRADDFALHNSSATTTTGRDGFRHSAEPVLVVAVRDLTSGRYLNDEGRTVSKSEWNDACGVDDWADDLLWLLAGFLCVLFVIIFLVVSLLTALFDRRAGRRRRGVRR